MARQRTAAARNDLVDYALFVRCHLVIDGEAEVNAMVLRWRGKWIGIVHTVTAMTIPVELISPPPSDESLGRLVFQLRWSAVFDRRSLRSRKNYNLNVHEVGQLLEGSQTSMAFARP